MQSASAASTRVEQPRLVEDAVGAGGGALRVDVRPAVARLDEAQLASGRNCPLRARRADVLAELRLDQSMIGRAPSTQRCAAWRSGAGMPSITGHRRRMLTSLAGRDIEGWRRSRTGRGERIQRVLSHRGALS